MFLRRNCGEYTTWFLNTTFEWTGPGLNAYSLGLIEGTPDLGDDPRGVPAITRWSVSMCLRTLIIQRYMELRVVILISFQLRGTAGRTNYEESAANPSF